MLGSIVTSLTSCLKFPKELSRKSIKKWYIARDSVVSPVTPKWFCQKKTNFSAILPFSSLIFLFVQAARDLERALSHSWFSAWFEGYTEFTQVLPCATIVSPGWYASGGLVGGIWSKLVTVFSMPSTTAAIICWFVAPKTVLRNKCAASVFVHGPL